MTLFSSFLDLLFPPRCTFCDAISRDPICQKCSDSVKFISEPFCTICGIPFKSDAVKSHLCGDCMKKRRPFSWARGVLLYNEATSHAVARFKYGRDTSFAKPLGTIISDYPDLKGFDLIIPVPLHIKRLKERGFNQSLLLARAAGKRHGIPVDPFSLKRTRWTEPQVNLKGKERKLNVKGAFEATKDMESKRVLLIDDVYTTGATASECARTLKKSGAKEVCILTLTRTAEL